MYWYRRRDSNPHCLVSKTSASCQLGYAGMVNLARFERASSTFAQSRSYSAELQVHEFGGRDRTRTRKRQCAVVFKTTALPVRLPFRIRICRSFSFYAFPRDALLATMRDLDTMKFQIYKAPVSQLVRNRFVPSCRCVCI